MRRARKKTFFNNTSTINEPCKSVPRRPKGLSRPRSLTRRSNELTQMHCKSVPSRALAQSQMSTTVSSRTVDMTPSPCRRLVTTRASTSTLPIPSTTLSKVEEEISPTTTINSLPRLLAIQASSRHGKSVPPRSSLSSVLQAQIQSRSIAGFSRSPVTTQLSQLSLQTSTSTLVPSDAPSPQVVDLKRLRK